MPAVGVGLEGAVVLLLEAYWGALAAAGQGRFEGPGGGVLDRLIGCEKHQASA